MIEVSFGPLDPNLFYRDFDRSQKVSSAARHLSAFAARLAFSLLYALLALPESGWEQIKGLATVNNLWGLCLIFGAWFLADAVSGPIGVAITAIVLAYGLYELWPVLKNVAHDLQAWFMGSYYGQNEQNLKIAGQHLADALSVGLITALEAVVLHRVFVGASAAMVEHFPPPQWFRRNLATVEEVRTRGAEARRAEDTRRRADENTRRKTDEDARRKTDEDARRKTDEDARRKTDEDARRKTDEDTRRKAAQNRSRSELQPRNPLSGAASRVLVPAGQGLGDVLPTALAVGGIVLVTGLGVAILATSERK